MKTLSKLFSLALLLSLPMACAQVEGKLVYGLEIEKDTTPELEAYIVSMIEGMELTHGELDGYKLFVYPDYDIVTYLRKQADPENAKKGDCIGGFTDTAKREIHTTPYSIAHEFLHVKIDHNTLGVYSGSDHSEKTLWSKEDKNKMEDLRQSTTEQIPFEVGECNYKHTTIKPTEKQPWN